MANYSNYTIETERLYEMATKIARTPGFSFLLVIEMVVSVCAILPNALLMYVLMRVTVFPMNLRILLIHLSMNLVWYAAAFWAKAVSILVAVVDGGDPRTLVTNSYLCKFTELANTIPLQNTVYSSLALCLERLYSTVLYKRYEKQHDKPWLALTAIPVVWAVSLANQLNSLFKITDMELRVPICESLLTTEASPATLILSLNLTCESLCVIIAVIVYLWNNYKLRDMTMNHAQQTLSSRFQISQNVQMNTIMMPSMVLQSLCYIPNYIFLCLVIFGFENIQLKAILLHVNYFWKLIYGVAHPIVAFNRKARLIHHLKKYSSSKIMRVFGKNPARVGPENVTVPVAEANAADVASATAMANTTAHFEALKSIWATQAAYYGHRKEKYEKPSAT